MKEENESTHLLTDGVDVRSTDSVWSSNVVFKVHVFTQVHLTGDGREDEALLTTIGHWKLNLAVKSAGPQQRWVQCVSSVCRHYHLRSINVNQLLRLSVAQTKKKTHQGLDVN